KLIARTSPSVIQKLTAGDVEETRQPAAVAPAFSKPLLVKPKISTKVAPTGSARSTASIRNERERDE
ncbi:MAG TPA: hypothetical protein VGE67_07025, partial [Haloferula sp.]